MKSIHNRRAFAAAAMIAALCLLASCVQPAGGREGGNLTLFLAEDQGRAISPGTQAALSYELYLSGPGGETLRYSAGPGTASVTLTLALGYWTVRAEAFQDGRPFGRGETAVTVEAGKTAQAALAMNLFPVWYVAAGGSDAPGAEGSEAAPLATVDEALSRISAAYLGEWSFNRGSTPAPARIVVSGTVTAGGASNLVDISEPSGNTMYDTYPPIILEGVNGGTLDAMGSKRVLYVGNADVILGPGLTLTGGNASDVGGGVCVIDGTLAMTGNAEIRNNTATDAGGGMYMSGGTFIMSGGTINGNTATIIGGGGVAFGTGGNFTMSGGTISGNHATGVSGGGVYFSGTTFTMSGGTIGNNQADVSGGGVYVAGTGTFTMTSGTISGNKADGTGGGGVYVASGGTFTKSGGIIYGDTNTTHTPGSGENTAASGSGHAVYVSTGSKKRNSTAGMGVALDSQTSGPADGWEFFASDIQDQINDVPASGTGTITLLAGTYDMNSRVEIKDNKIITLTTEPGAAVKLLRQSGHTGIMIDVTGGGLTLKTGAGGSLTLDGNGVTGSQHLVKVAGGGDLRIESGVTLSGNKTGSNGSGVYFSGGTFTMSGGTIGGSGAGKNTGYNGGGVAVNAGNFTMTGGTIGGNTASSNGGGVYFSSGAGTFTMSGGTIGDNTASGNGGGVYMLYGTFKKEPVSPATTSGTIYGSNAPSGQANTASSGHAVYVAGGSPKFRDTTADAGVNLNSTTGSPGVDPWI